MGKKVLVVDDSMTVRQQVGAVLTQAGYDVVEASDGVEGVEAIAAHADLKMVICDVNMPRLNGLDMVEKVKAGGLNANLPIIMLTTEGSPALIQKAKGAGAKGWILKPFKPDQLLATVEKLTA